MTPLLPTSNLIQTDRGRFVILKKLDGVATTGVCTRWGRKFFTSSECSRNALSAEDYLRGKFGDHDCQLESPRL